jgi:glutaredoxin
MEFNFIVYTVPNCSECDDVKEFIVANSNPSENIDHLKLTVIESVLETQEQIDGFHSRYGHTTVPQIYLATEKEEYIGDGKDLKKFISEMKQNVAVFKRENTAVII